MLIFYSTTQLVVLVVLALGVICKDCHLHCVYFTSIATKNTLWLDLALMALFVKQWLTLRLPSILRLYRDLYSGPGLISQALYQLIFSHIILCIVSLFIKCNFDNNLLEVQGIISRTSSRRFRLHRACDEGDRRACIQFGMIIGENREHRAEWRREHPELFGWDRR